MSKERLEEIDVVHYESDQKGNQFALLKEDDYWYLKEQSERVESLRMANRELVELGEYILKNFRSDIDGTTTETAQKVMDRMDKQNKRYREALGDVLNNDEMYITNQEIILEALEGDPHD